MTIPWYRLAVFALWLAAMSWLTIEKILPPFFTGEPPVYESTGDGPRPPVAWYLYWGERRLGWALSEMNQQSTDTTEIHSLVHFDSLPLDELLPIYLRAIAHASSQAAGSLEMEVETDLITNSALNQLVSFYSKFRPKNGQSLVKIDGNVEGDKLKLAVRAGDWDHDFEMPLPDNKVRDSFSPEMMLRGLHLGQSWTFDSYSPLGLPSRPMDMIQGRPPTERLFAKVEERTELTWDGQLEPMWLVVYRSDAAVGSGGERNIRNRLWVHRDGTVVRQEVVWGDHSLLFTRMPEREATKLRNEHREFSRQHVPAQP
jgi:hypothetical protein